MIRHLVALSVFAGAFVSILSAQPRVSPEHYGHKVWAVVPLAGTGKPGDAKRPVLVPSDAELDAAAQASKGVVSTTVPNLLGYTMQLSDDGKSGLVEFTFSSPVGYHNFLVRSAARAEIRAVTNEAEIDIAKLNSGQTGGSDIKNLAAKTQSVQNAVQSAVPGLQLFERGKASQDQIVAAFRKAKANFSLPGATASTTGGAQ